MHRCALTLPAGFGRVAASGVLVFALIAGAVGCAAPPGPRTDPGSGRIYQTGLASWYSDALHGRPTASGEPYDRNAMTAAHRSLPFGTVVRVTRTDTGRSVVVTVNDRGPFVDGRIIDLSRHAAEELQMVEAGVAPVRLELLD